MKCFEAHKDYKISCNNTDCKFWIRHSESMNCTVLAGNKGPMTLQKIGDIFGVTRMRICQIEKKTLSKLLVSIENGKKLTL
jgi:hypothetical protein